MALSSVLFVSVFALVFGPLVVIIICPFDAVPFVCPRF